MAGKKILLMALVFAIAASALVYTYVSQSGKPAKEPEYSNVLVALKNIEKNAVITPNDVKTVRMIKSYINQKAVASTDKILGKRARERILEGEQILEDRIADREKQVMAYNIPEGKRAVSIKVNEALEVGDFVRPGDYVDILATFEKYDVEDSSPKITYPKTTKTILQNIMVLGVGQLMDIPDKSKAGLPKTITLAVTPDEAEKLVFGEEAGVLRMALRPVGDNKTNTTSGIVREDVAATRSKGGLSR